MSSNNNDTNNNNNTPDGNTFKLYMFIKVPEMETTILCFLFVASRRTDRVLTARVNDTITCPLERLETPPFFFLFCFVFFLSFLRLCIRRAPCTRLVLPSSLSSSPVSCPQMHTFSNAPFPLLSFFSIVSPLARIHGSLECRDAKLILFFFFLLLRGTDRYLYLVSSFFHVRGSQCKTHAPSGF